MKDLGCIYLIHAIGTNRYKIGMTLRDVEVRYKELDSKQSPYPLKFIGYVETYNAREVEKSIHDILKDNRVHGEWFCFDEKDILKVKITIRNQANEPEIPPPPNYQYDVYDFVQPVLYTSNPIDETVFFCTGEIIDMHWATMPDEELRKNKTGLAVEEKLKRSFSAITNYNDYIAADVKSMWVVNNEALRQLSGCSEILVKEWIVRHQAAIDDHNNKHELGSYHNKGRGDITEAISWSDFSW